MKLILSESDKANLLANAEYFEYLDTAPAIKLLLDLQRSHDVATFLERGDGIRLGVIRTVFGADARAAFEADLGAHDAWRLSPCSPDTKRPCVRESLERMGCLHDRHRRVVYCLVEDDEEEEEEPPAATIWQGVSR